MRSRRSSLLDAAQACLPWHPPGLLAGVDEAGRGPLAGPVCAAAVILPLGLEIPGLNDSKKLTEKKRDELYEIITGSAVSVAYLVISGTAADFGDSVDASVLTSSLRAVAIIGGVLLALAAVMIARAVDRPAPAGQQPVAS